MKEGAFVKNYFAHCVDVEELYENMVSPVCEKYELTYMEFTVLMFLANNPQYDTATQIVRYRHLAKSHVSVSIRSLQERGLILAVIISKIRLVVCVVHTASTSSAVICGLSIQYETSFSTSA